MKNHLHIFHKKNFTQHHFQNLLHIIIICICFKVQKLKLEINERVKRGGGTAEWAQYLLDIGEDKIQKDDHQLITLPKSILSKANDMHQFVHNIFPNLGTENQSIDDFKRNLL